MKLQDYLAQQQLKMAPFGRLCGVKDRSVFRRYVVGTVMPPRQVVISVYKATKGQVTPNDWFDLPCELDSQFKLPFEQAA